MEERGCIHVCWNPEHYLHVPTACHQLQSIFNCPPNIDQTQLSYFCGEIKSEKIFFKGVYSA